MKLIRITAPHFCAGLIVGQRTAPILRYMAKWSVEEINRYCDRKRWKVEHIEPDKETMARSRVAE